MSENYTADFRSDSDLVAFDCSISKPLVKDQPRVLAQLRRQMQASGVVLAITLSSITTFTTILWCDDRRRRDNTTVRYELAENPATMKYRFERLASQWRAERGPASSIRRMAMNFAYQQIIGMGNDAVALILHELKSRPDHWFWALTAITGANPIPHEDRGKINRMAEAWVRWGKENGYR